MGNQGTKTIAMTMRTIQNRMPQIQLLTPFLLVVREMH